MEGDGKMPTHPRARFLLSEEKEQVAHSLLVGPASCGLGHRYAHGHQRPTLLKRRPQGFVLPRQNLMAWYFQVELIKLLPRAFKTRKVYVVCLFVPFKEGEMVIKFSKLSRYENSRITGGIAFWCYSSLVPPPTPENSKIQLKTFFFSLERSAQLPLYPHYILSIYIYFYWVSSCKEGLLWNLGKWYYG